MSEIKRVFDILNKVQADNLSDCLAFKKDKQWHKISGIEFTDKVNQVSAALLENGITKGDRVAIISNNRPEWNFVDYACQQIGVITVPIFPTASLHDMSFILKHAEVRAVFFSSKDIEKKIDVVLPELSNFSLKVAFDKTDQSTMPFDLFLTTGNQILLAEKGYEIRNKIKAIASSIREDELFTILYTSGTTGNPKGVMLSHQNLVSNVKYCIDFAPFHKMKRALSFLPLNHVYERMINTLYLHEGIGIYYAEGLEKIADNLKEVKPQVFGTVPRLLERVYDKIVGAGEKLTGIKKKIFFWALDIALNFEFEKQNHFGYSIKRKIADKLVFSKWRAALGGEIICAASGGAALQPRLTRVFCCAGIPVLEGYGLTETSPVVAVNSMQENGISFGSVGKVLKSLDVKIAEDGEILVNGPSVMMGYYKNPEATSEVMSADGYFHTGDIGVITGDQFLKITDRKKEIFKTSSGKYIAPLMIENKIKECRLVEQVMVIGEGEKYASALIIPAFDNVKEWCKHKGIDFVSAEYIIQNTELKKEIQLFIREMNKSLAPYEQIKRPELISKSWTVESGELTPKMSMKRKVIKENNKDIISKIFSSGDE
jgi:long-chain acyl-CoA synthetase